MSTAATAQTHKGGTWLLEETDAAAVFSVERLSDEHRLMAQTAREFVMNEVLPQLDRLEQKDWTLARDLLRRCGELGLLGTDAPERYGGVELDKVSAVVVAESIARSSGFASAFGAQTGLTIVPILCFGTEGQKREYLPKLVTGEMVGAYALSESGAGSDALGAKARATRQPDGSYTLNGEKMWITNGGFADLFVVFAKVDGKQFTAFLVERAFPGVTTGKEEHKMGLLGSSTTPLILQETRVPAENVLGEVGKGHKVAFNVLNYGRFKLGAFCTGGGVGAIGEAVQYAKQRKQFGQPIATFGAIKQKIALMTVYAYGVESALYRTAGMIDAMMSDWDDKSGSAMLASLEEFAIESSIAKVAGSEMLDFVLDENVQIHGGNGYVRDYPAERHYRDARVFRIFEGTNEINRLLIPGMLIRRAVKGDLPLIPAAKRLQEEILSPSSAGPTGDAPLEEQRGHVAAFKKVALMIAGTAMQTYGEKLADEQEILIALADIVIDTFLAESAVLRAIATVERGDRQADLHIDAARVFVNDAAARVDASAKQALAAMTEGDTLRTLVAALRRILKVMPINTVALQRRLADATIAQGTYVFRS
ncbi:MAG: acyl-CoA dehydrogenase family protein [Acidobacteria bacterium]|nr:acyl-CoA dehydrogenase family protein [Acidobacteriota bacterium]